MDAVKRLAGRVTIDGAPNYEFHWATAMTHCLRTLSQRRFAAVLCAALGGWSPHVEAQTPRAARIPSPESYSLTTKDGVQIGITYYGSNAGPQAVPVILLHDFNETRAVFEPLARLLQNPPADLQQDLPPGAAPQPRAVVTVDLRGHGQSKTAFDADGLPAELDASRFQLPDFEDMVLYDLEAVRSFLVERNDAGELNLNKLCIVGAGMGANVALNYAARDWAIPNLMARKQGQDVKALVLLSPTRMFHGLSSIEPLKFPPIQQQLSVFLAYGAGAPKIVKDCETMAKTWSRYHPEPPRQQIATLKSFFVFAPQTQRQGTELLTSEEFGLAPRIAGFIELRLGRIDYPHVVRKRP
jgi:pimeloyl-ACP methyl ester carboxylesterase